MQIKETAQLRKVKHNLILYLMATKRQRSWNGTPPANFEKWTTDIAPRAIQEVGFSFLNLVL